MTFCTIAAAWTACPFSLNSKDRQEQVGVATLAGDSREIERLISVVCRYRRRLSSISGVVYSTVSANGVFTSLQALSLPPANPRPPSM